MTFDLTSIQSGPSADPPRILIYADGGVGKNTFAANAKNPIFIRTEDGCGNLDIKTFPICKSFHDVLSCLQTLGEQEHGFETLVVDSLDWLEPLIWDYVLETNPRTEKGQPATDINSYGYGKGYALAMDVWETFITCLNTLRDQKHMTILLIAHAHIKKYDDPENGSYDTYRIKLNEKAAAKLVEDMDMVLFAKFQTVIQTDKSTFGQEKKRAIGGFNRVIYTQTKPAAYAKNRYNLASEIVIPQGDTTWNAAWGVIAEAVPYYKNQTNN